MRNKVLSIITLVLLISFFVGVSSVLAASSDEEINISFTWWGDTKRHEIYNRIVDLFEEENPNIKVDRPFGSWTQYWDKLATQIASGGAPDVVGMHQRFVSDYVPRGALLNLETYMESGVIDTSAIPEAVVNGGYVNGKPYMVAQGVVTTGIVYNTAVFDDLGVSYPDMNWTWEEHADKLIEIRESAKAKGLDMWGAGDSSGGFFPSFAYYARSNGENIYTENGEIGLTEDTIVSWFNYWKELREKDAIPDPATSVEYDGLPLEQSLFNTGKAALLILPANQIWLYQNQVTNGGQIDIVRMPHSAGKLPGEYIEGSYLAVTSGSKHPEAAAKLISFFINNPEAQKTFMVEQGVPPTTTAVENIYDKLSAPQKRSIDFVQETLAIAEKAPYPPTGATEIMARFEEIAQAISFGYQTPEEGAAEFMQTAEDILSMNK